MHCSAQVQKPCAKCKRDFTCMSKDQSGETICKPCKSKRVLFIQMFGKWPIALFLELSDEQQIAVWQSGNTKKMLQAKLMEEVTNQRVEEDTTRESGSYMPIAYYAKKGYPTKSIVANCEKRYDEQLKEMTYKVMVHTDIKDTVARKVRSEIVNLRNTDLRSKLSHYASPGKKTRKRKSRSPSSSAGGKLRNRPGSSSSSSSSNKSSKSSSDSSDSPKTKKAKAFELAKKERKAAAEKAAAAKVIAVANAKREKLLAAAAAKQAAKDPILLFMPMYRDIYYIVKTR
jgi:hypothetical protein